MKITFDKEKIQAVLEFINAYTNTTVTLFDSHMNCVVDVGEWKDYCLLIGDKEDRLSLCKQCNHIHSQQSASQNGIVKYCCHAGIAEAVTPIIANGNLVAYFMIGKFRDAEQTISTPNAVIEAAKKYDLPEGAMLDAYYKLPELNEQQIDRAISAIKICVQIIAAEYIQVEHHKVFTIVEEYVRNNFKSKIYIDDLCKLCDVSRATLYKIMYSEIQLSPMDYVSSYRVSVAKKLLASTKLSLEKIAIDCGFSDHKTFERAFVQFEKMTPAEYRQTCASPLHPKKP